MIYVLIAGTYTPFSLITLRGTWGIVILSVVWGLAAVGMLLKLRFTGRYPHFRTMGGQLFGYGLANAFG